jgi:hypothetical protein
MATVPIADVAPQHLAAGWLAFPTLIAEMHPAFDQRLPVWLAATLETATSAQGFQTCVLYGASHGCLTVLKTVSYDRAGAR